MAIGIEKIGVYPCSLSLDMDSLCEARGYDKAMVRETMLIEQRSLNPPYEDPVTMAVNAAKGILSEEDRRSIQLLIVGSESGLDAEKPLSSWVHRYLGLNEQCRNFEIKQACGSATAGLQMAAGWLASGLAPDAKALIIATDQSRPGLGQESEFVLGAGAAAILLSDRPRLFELELDRWGHFACEVDDILRPTARVEIGNTKTSLLAYLDGLEAAYNHYSERAGGADFERDFARNVYHVPFGGMSFLAHKTLLRLQGPFTNQEAWTHFTRRSLPALCYNRLMGGTYAASTFIALLGLLDSDPTLQPGDRIGMFAYGSGSSAEFYSGLVGYDARRAAAEAGLPALLAQRRPVTVEEYEAIEMGCSATSECPDFETPLDRPTSWYASHYEGKGLLVFRGARGYRRQYAWS